MDARVNSWRPFFRDRVLHGSARCKEETSPTRTACLVFRSGDIDAFHISEEVTHQGMEGFQ